MCSQYGGLVDACHIIRDPLVGSCTVGSLPNERYDHANNAGVGYSTQPHAVSERFFPEHQRLGGVSSEPENASRLTHCSSCQS
jgi:hypothetical protein